MSEDTTVVTADVPVTTEVVDTEKEQLKAKVVELEESLKTSNENLKKAKDAWKSDVKELKDSLKKSQEQQPAVAIEGNYVILDGQKYDIIWRSTVKDLALEGYQKKALHDDQTTLVINKSGG